MRFNNEDREIEEFNGADIKRLNKYAMKRFYQNHSYIRSAMGHVGGNPNAPLLDPVYLARAKATKELKQRLAAYSGCDELASDLVYTKKLQSDAAGRDFLQTAQEEITGLIGKKCPSYPNAVVSHCEENKTIYSYISNFIINHARTDWIIAGLMLILIYWIGRNE